MKVLHRISVRIGDDSGDHLPAFDGVVPSGQARTKDGTQRATGGKQAHEVAVAVHVRTSTGPTRRGRPLDEPFAKLITVGRKEDSKAESGFA